MNRIFDLGMGIIVVAGITTVVSRSNSARIISALGDTFSRSLKAAMGR